ncbi:TetR/AcrR family transcriptional regulator [Paenibacillus harenae]|uniref:TetR/AcrR family transcriptional regulator n=1 Tax=Paenibacillus harenae TaxID=306543 RepID=UPI00041267D3|nr:TetR/AcrR family transcriptional regulator [Paenibacillus harenae]
MPKKFNEQEKEWIRHKLLEEGKRNFEAAGLRKTSVEDLTKVAGIAQGSFYSFFESKEVLFYTLLLDEESRIRKQLLESYLSDEGMTKERIKSFMLDAFRLISESPLMKQIYLAGDFEQLVRKLPQELLERNFTEDQDALMPVIRKWQSSGFLSGTRPELIVSMLRSLVLLSLHKKEIGEAIFDDTITLMVDLIAEGMYAYHESGSE